MVSSVVADLLFGFVSAIVNCPEQSSLDGTLVDYHTVLLVVSGEDCHGDNGVGPNGQKV